LSPFWALHVKLSALIVVEELLLRHIRPNIFRVVLVGPVLGNKLRGM
jgi:hypothetical protein